MIPVPGLDSVRCAWIDIKAHGFTLHGFLVYLASDHPFPEYIDGEGLADLDTWTGSDCAVFIVQSPSVKWIEYTRSNNHIWWRLFGNLIETEGEMKKILIEHGNTPAIEIDGSKRTLRDVFAPCLNHFQHSAEIAKILRRFNLKPTDHPSLILFKDLKDRKAWHVDMADMVNLPVCDLRTVMHRWFASTDFHNLITEASRA